MALDGQHVAGQPGHVQDHNAIDTALSTLNTAASGYARDLVDRFNDTTETVPINTITNTAVSGVNKTAPAVPAVVTNPPAKFAVRNTSTGNITVTAPSQTGVVSVITILPGEVLTMRQKTTQGWGAESGNKPLTSLDSRFAPITGSTTYVQYLQAAMTPEQLIAGTITRDVNGAATGAPVVWPDGSPGTYAGTASASFPGAVDAYTITYGSPVTKTYTQAALTRDGNGNVTARPLVTVA